MRRAQITLFIIVGIVVVLTVVILILIVSNLRPDQEVTGIQSDVTLANTCLARTTQDALAALQNDGVITLSEGGIMPDNAEPYFYIEEYTGTSSYLPLGRNRYIGLCDYDGPNGIGLVDNRLYTCHSTVYHPPISDELPSIQEQLQIAITKKMQTCLEAPGEAEVIIQDDTLVVRWDNPEIAHTERTNIQRVWTAIAEVVNKEVTQPGFEPTATLLDCEGCNNLLINEITEADHNYHSYEFIMQNETIATIHFEERGIVYQPPFETDIKEDQISIACPTTEVSTIYSEDNDDLSLISPVPGVQLVSQAIQGQTAYRATIDDCCSTPPFTVTDGEGNNLDIERDGGSCP